MISIEEPLVTDVLVIGAGIGGLRAAIGACDSGAKTMVVTKGIFGKDGAATWMAGSGFQAAVHPADSVEAHVRDTTVAGKYINNQKLVYEIMKHSPQMVAELENWGFRFLKEGGKYRLHQGPGYSFPRSPMNIRECYLGTEWRKVIPRQVSKRKIDILEDFYITDLMTKDGRVTGAMGIDLKQGILRPILAKAIILATGGYIACYEHFTGNRSLVGDGQAMAYRAGAELMDMEFVQFMPVAIVWPPALSGTIAYSLIALQRGILYNRSGERFMERYYPDKKEFVPRQAQARAIFREVKEERSSPHGGVFLSQRHLPRNLIDEYVRTSEGNRMWKDLKINGIDLYEDGIEVYPAGHYSIGGLSIDKKCRATLNGLYAVGEVGSGGKDGADRLPGNAITFCFCMGIIAGSAAAKEAKETVIPHISKAQLKELQEKIMAPMRRDGKIKPYELKNKIRRIMQAEAFFGRTGKGLERGAMEIEEIREKDLPKLYCPSKTVRMNGDWVDAIEARNMVDVAEAVFRAAAIRKESRGLHERDDYPQEDSKWLQHILVKKESGGMKFRREQIKEFPYAKPPYKEGKQ